MRTASSRVVSLWIAILCLLAALFSLDGLASAQTDTWTGGGGSLNTNWSDASNWNNGAITSGENVLINLAIAATDGDNSPTIGTLTLSKAGDSVAVPNNTTKH